MLLNLPPSSHPFSPFAAVCKTKSIVSETNSFPFQRQSGDRLRILVVDSYPDICDLFTLVLEEIGAEVVVANSCAKALVHIQENPPDVLISEVFLPDENGLTLVRKAKALVAQNKQTILTLAVTSYADKKEQEEICSAGFQRCLSKPVDVYRLVEVVVEMIQEQEGS